jgi:hypothetical protein
VDFSKYGGMLMKKVIVISVVMLVALCFGTVAMAANQVVVQANSEGITMEEGACEKFGSLKFVFDAGTVLTDQDWWRLDLPVGVTLCRSIDFAILGNAGNPVPGGGGGLPVAVIAVPDGATVAAGFITIKDLGTDGLPGGITVAGTSPLWFRVSGVAGSSRVRIEVYDEDAADYTNPLCADGSTTMTVAADTEFELKILDSLTHNSNDDPTGPWGYNDSDADNQFGEQGLVDELGTTGGAGGNDYDNTYCASAFGYSQQTVNVSINSGGSAPNFLNFIPTNPQVANLVSATLIELSMCKADEFGYVTLEGGQNAVCVFDYDTGHPFAGYCLDVGTANFTGSTVGGNKIIIRNTSGTFFDPADNYRIVLRTPGNGAYWAATGPANINGFYPGNGTQCNAIAAPNEAYAVTWTAATETATAFTTYATGIGCGAVAAGSAVVSQTSSIFTGIDDTDMLTVNLPAIVFDPAQFSSGDQVAVTVELWRLPCGMVFSGNRTVAQFVDTCPTAAPGSVLLYPYATPLNDPDWWFGMSLCNPVVPNMTAVAGSYTITLYEDDGDSFQYDSTEDLAPGDMVTFSGQDLLGLTWTTLTSDGGGIAGDARCHFVVNCMFGPAGGFGMQGNGVDSTGYVPYGSSAYFNY